MKELLDEIVKNSNMFQKRKLNEWWFYSYKFFNPIEYFDLKEKYGDIVRELRGLQVHNKTCQVVYSIKKFFNVDEITETKMDRIKSIERIEEKIDGSLIKIYYNQYTNEIEISTRNSFNGLFINKCNEIIDKKGLREKIEKILDEHKDYVLLFELVSKKNRVVVEYEDENLYLLQVRNGKGEYIDINQFDFDKPKQYDVSFEELKRLRDELQNFEGWVLFVEFVDGEKDFVKFKTKWYFERNETNRITEKQLLKLIQEEKIDDVINKMSDVRKKEVNRIINELNLLHDNIYNKFTELKLNTLTKKNINLSDDLTPLEKKLFIYIWDTDLNVVKDKIRKFLKNMKFRMFENLKEHFLKVG